ncbi:Clan CD, family C13, asparaginyl endopeptidase-like cysteine peptidase [Tritrichomonas foetus]|uniref:Clan CD, family C13, asparaginyl endopeptidase-like cysteine peptidase n=1 Tax=Tritrichomonas foetus TaxID=1144522 RepID=A0A1J4JHS5_9EUKA|nr:Clan CD, family C13, asparaginyl endopeptidase-like cysteine peptidase [Tritrichomonas foetus]|eukprot:OHS96788.1 Clan CD, family C13, asparaginyl endopeptidase-like cysteine peptidase [Tritrichomonas foetus]
MIWIFLILIKSQTYAIVVAGSSSFKNYRHQADAFHMYNTLRSRGIPESNIVLFSYNDLLNSEQNPFPGKIINEPNGPNVYPGDQCIDFSGPYVTAPVFYSVLYGNNQVGKRISLTENDTLLIFFNDHGAPGLLSMPRESGTKLYANELRDLFGKMKTERKFNKIFFVIEACESGSVGEVIDVPDVFTITASNAIDPSHAAKWDDNMNAFLSNEFTSNIFKFLENNVDSSVENFVQYITNKTNKSDVCIFGDKSVMENKLSDFFGLGSVTNHDFNENEEDDDLGILMNAHSVFPASLLMMLKKQPPNATEKKHQLIQSFNQEMKRRKIINNRFREIYKHFDMEENINNANVKIQNWTCYKIVVTKAEKLCGPYDESSYHSLAVFANLCNNQTDINIMKEVRKICAPKKVMHHTFRRKKPKHTQKKR